MFKADIKLLFFDSHEVTSRLDKAERRVLSKIGAAIRKAAMMSLKYGKGKSPAGTPPHAHKHQGFTRRFGKSKTGRKRASSPLRELIHFAYDPATSSVVVGPVLFRGSAVGAGKAPRVLEEGGRSPVLRRGKLIQGTYPPRPYMSPALRQTLPMANQAVKDMIR